MTARSRPWGRWLAYAIICGALLGLTAVTNDTAVARWMSGRDAPPTTESGTPPSEPAATSTARQDVAACVQITDIAQRYRDDELTDRGYVAAFERAIAGAAPDGDVARYAETSLRAFVDGDATAGERARTGLAEACDAAAG